MHNLAKFRQYRLNRGRDMAHPQTHIQTYSLQYFTTAPAGEVIIVEKSGRPVSQRR